MQLMKALKHVDICGKKPIDNKDIFNKASLKLINITESVYKLYIL